MVWKDKLYLWLLMVVQFIFFGWSSLYAPKFWLKLAMHSKVKTIFAGGVLNGSAQSAYLVRATFDSRKNLRSGYPDLVFGECICTVFRFYVFSVSFCYQGHHFTFFQKLAEIYKEKEGEKKRCSQRPLHKALVMIDGKQWYQ